MLHNFQHLLEQFQHGGRPYSFYNLARLDDPRLARLPFSIRVLLECAVRNCDQFAVKAEDVQRILDWEQASLQDIEIPFKPARVVLQDFTGVPLVVDLAAMRDAVRELGEDPRKVNPLCPVDLVVDHSIQVDFAGSAGSLAKNEEKEFERNVERFRFLKWGSTAFDNFRIVPPGSGIVHQVNLQFLARTVMENQGLLYPDSVIGTDSHTTMINGLGVLGWGVGGIEAEAVMLGECMSMTLPQVVGFKLTGTLPPTSTATDLVLTCTAMLRRRGVVEKFVQFFGPGVASLSLADRATVSNMAPEYGATVGYFAPDQRTLDYLLQTGRQEQRVSLIAEYLRRSGLMRNYSEADAVCYSGDVLELDLANVVASVAGPKRPHDFVKVSAMKNDWKECLSRQVGFKGFGVAADKVGATATLTYEGKEFVLGHGAVVIAAITSCTNTSNPGVMLAAGLICQRAVARGLRVKPYIKTSLSPGSQVVQRYYQKSGLMPHMEALGFAITGYGCMTCIGNSGEIHPALEEAVEKAGLVVASVLSGNRNFEGRVHPATRANYLASPPLVVGYALAGTVDIDFEKEPLGTDKEGKPVFLHELWPSREEVAALQRDCIQAEMFRSNYASISKGTERWNGLAVQKSQQYKWEEKSTYIRQPPFFKNRGREPHPLEDIAEARVLALFGDSITTDHISPAGNISTKFSAAKYLKERGVPPAEFNSYGARRGNDEVMSRGTFSNVRIVNKMMGGKVGPLTKLWPEDKEVEIFEAAEQYRLRGEQLVVIGGKEYGSGSSRDWAAKGPYLLGVRAVIAQSFERIHRSNLVGMGVLPLQFLPGQSADTLGLTGSERLSVGLEKGKLKPGQLLSVLGGKAEFQVKCRLNTEVEVAYFSHGGILPFVLRKIVKGGKET